MALISVRSVAERMHPPRAFYGEFPLGRPLGVPGDAAFQRDLLLRAFALLDEPTGPVLADHPTVLEYDETPMACALPPRSTPICRPRSTRPAACATPMTGRWPLGAERRSAG